MLFLEGMGRIFVGVLALGLLSLGTVSARAACTKDTECKGDRICDAGQCVSPPAPPSSATTPLPPPPPPPPANGAESAPPPSAPSVPPSPAPVAAPPASAPPPVSPLAPPGYIYPSVPVQRYGTAAPLRARPPRRSTGMFASGIVMTALAPVAALTALVAYTEKVSCQTDHNDYRPTGASYSSAYGSDCTGYDDTITGSLIVGAVLLAAGIPMVVYGSQRVPESEAASVSVVPLVSADRSGLSLVGRF